MDVRDGTTDSFQVIGTLIASLVAPQSAAAVLDAMTDPRCHVVSLTITGKGYCRSPASGALQFDHPDIAHDLREAAAPRRERWARDVRSSSVRNHYRGDLR